MARLDGHGLSAELPAGFEGRILRRSPSAGASTYPIAQFATFPIPAHAADFGGGATTLMSDDDVFVVLADYGPSSLGKALFARQGLPRPIELDYFKPYTLRRGVRKQAGTQWFFTEAGRPFTLYAVIGAFALRSVLVPRVNELLAGITINGPVAP